MAVPSLKELPEEATAGCTQVLGSLMDFKPENFGLPPFSDTIHGVVPMSPVWTLKVPRLRPLPISPPLPNLCPLQGPVVRGFGRGSATLGIPTANLPPESLITELAGAVSGIYCGAPQPLPFSFLCH